MINIIDYGIGNLRSIEKAFERVGADLVRSDRVEDMERADKLVLPGVGAFGACADELRRRGLDEPLIELVRAGKPLLGVCVGLQLLFEESEELGLHRGLGLLPGRVVRFVPVVQRASAKLPAAVGPAEIAVEEIPLKIPHMGWNTVYARDPGHPLLHGIADGSFFYFVHSYYVAPASEGDILATTPYGEEFASIVARDHILGVQFHPEKSHHNGLRILENFAKL